MSSASAIETRAGTTVPLAALDGTRSERLRALRLLEAGLRRDGWVRLVADGRSGLAVAERAVYSAAAALFADRAACARYQRDALLAAAGFQSLALTYLGLGDEPLYDAAAASQRVRSFNMHEAWTPERCAALPYDDDERELARAYHDWPCGDGAIEPLRAAAADLRRELSAGMAVPLLRAFALLLGLSENALLSRTEARRSDNTSMLRALEYPPDGREEAGGGDLAWGVSEHTDFECFSLLHEQRAGLQLCSPEGVWHAPQHGGDADDDGAPRSWVLIVGDMLARLSGGYFVATPHRVPPTRGPAAAPPRRSLVFFQAFDEEEAIEPVNEHLARRGVTGGYRQWAEEERADGRARAPVAAVADMKRALTQREWTEWKEAAARERARSRALR